MWWGKIDHDQSKKVKSWDSNIGDTKNYNKFSPLLFFLKIEMVKILREILVDFKIINNALTCDVIFSISLFLKNGLCSSGWLLLFYSWTLFPADAQESGHLNKIHIFFFQIEALLCHSTSKSGKKALWSWEKNFQKTVIWKKLEH